MTDDFCLSDKEKYSTTNGIDKFPYYDEKDVKEFIKRLKDDIVFNDIYTADEIFKIINKLVGEKLTK